MRLKHFVRNEQKSEVQPDRLQHSMRLRKEQTFPCVLRDIRAEFSVGTILMQVLGSFPFGGDTEIRSIVKSQVPLSDV
jgi:hypothetical protein